MKAIETVYNGYRFRSRLEARWAVFFDALGIAYEYEKEGYDLNGVFYLPDFWLPKYQIWVEIKGEAPTKEEREKAMRLCEFTEKDVYILCGSDFLVPDVRAFYFMRWSEAHDELRQHMRDDPEEYGGANPDGAGFACEFVTDEETIRYGVRFHRDFTDGQLRKAFYAARQARFEHGECP